MESTQYAREMQAVIEMGETTGETAVLMGSHHQNSRRAHKLRKAEEVTTGDRMRSHTD